MKVSKFGGTSLADAGQIMKVANIVLDDQDRRIVVVSAPGKRHSDDIKVTDLLISLANKAHESDDCGKELNLVVERYREIAKGLSLDDKIINTIRQDLEERLKMDKEPFPKFMDTLKAAGEDNNAKLVAEYMISLGADATYMNPKDAGMFLTDEFGNACVLKESIELLARLKEEERIVIFPGFFGYSKSGDVVTFPRGGSDITGSILAAAVCADKYENFTDVDSVFAANPKVVDNPVGIEAFTYREMRELSYAGFSVLHEETLEPVYKAHIPVCIKNTNNPNLPGTMILPKREFDPQTPVVGIAADGGFMSVYISKYMMNREIGFGRKVLQILEELEVPYEHMPSGIDNISIILKEKFFPIEKEESFVNRVRDELCVDEINVQRDLAIAMIVGEGMLEHIGTAGRAASALADAKVNIHMINQGSSEVSIMFGIYKKDVDKAICSLYQAFFG